LHVAGHALSASLTDCTARRPLRMRPVPYTPGATPMRLRRMWNNFRALQGARMAASALVCAASLRKTRAGAPAGAKKPGRGPARKYRLATAIVAIRATTSSP
jgi:hypothetical protein